MSTSLDTIIMLCDLVAIPWYETNSLNEKPLSEGTQSNNSERNWEGWCKPAIHRYPKLLKYKFLRHKEGNTFYVSFDMRHNPCNELWKWKKREFFKTAAYI